MAKTPKIHKCPYPDCDYVIKQKGNLTIHIRRKHTGEKPYKCDYPNCDYAAASQGDLTQHIRRNHTEEKPFNCDYPNCDYAAASQGDLTQHIRHHHTGEKPYKCDYPNCDYAAASQGQLMHHIRCIHTGEKPYQCDYPNCDYAAASQGQLTVHIRRHHTGEKPYECPRCDFAAASASNLTRHLHSKACEYSRREAYLWQKLCRKMTVFLRPDCERLPSTIMTPGIDGKEYIMPDNPLQHPDGTIEFIEAKRTPNAIREKDTDVYPLKADKVTFWCLFGNPGRFKDNPALSIEISDHLIRQLETQKTSANEEAIDQLILQITLLQLGIDFTKQRLLMPFFEDSEEDS